MDTVATFFDYLDKLITGDESVIDALSNLVWGLAYIFIDGFLTIIETMVDAIDLGANITSVASSWGVLPPQLVYLINSLGVPQALALVGWAFGIRFMLNLLPGSITRI